MTIIILGHILYLVYLCSRLGLGLFVMYLCHLFFIAIFIAINYKTPSKQMYLFFVHYLAYLLLVLHDNVVEESNDFHITKVQLPSVA